MCSIGLYIVLRVYDRGMDPPKSDTRLVHMLKGFKNKNWPVKSSFYCGTGCMSTPLTLPTVLKSCTFAVDNASILTRQTAPTIGDKDTDLLASGGDYVEFPEMKEEKSVLLATGSADPYAYLYNVGEVC